MQALKIIGLLLVALVLAFVAMLVFRMAPRMHMSATVPQQVITNFDECAAAGNPVMESYPEQCRTADGRLFVNIPAEVGDEAIQHNRCAVAGCSQQLCVSADEASTIVTTCEFRSEYSCYREASCEPQADGECGWTQTPALKQCLANPPMEGGLEVR